MPWPWAGGCGRKVNATVPAEDTSAVPVWNDPALSLPARVDALIDAMTLQEKTAQLYGVWVGASDQGGEVAPTSTTWRRPSISTHSCRPVWGN